MSAWTVSKLHIDVLVQALGERELVGGLSPDEIGRELWAENYRSVNYRYSRRESTPPYVYAPPTSERILAGAPEHLVGVLFKVSPGLVLQQAECYDYQSCEHFGWANSQSKTWIDALTTALESIGTDYDEYTHAPWGV